MELSQGGARNDDGLAGRLRLREADPSLAVLAIVATIVTWGLVSPLIKSASVSGEVLAFYRLWIGALALLLFAGFTRRTLLDGAWRLSMLSGVLFGVNVLCFVFSIKLTTVANATLIGALQPAITLLVAGRLFGETTTARDVFCVVLAIVGVGVVIGGSAGTPEWNPAGDALAVAAVLTFTVYFLVTKHARATSGVIEYITLVHVAAGMVVTPTVVARPHGLVELSASDIAIVLFFALVSGTLGQLVVGWAQRYIDVSVSSLMLLGVPVIATAAAWAMLGEEIGPLQVLGGAITLAAIGATVWRRTGGPPVITPVPAAESTR
jgi:drug/metabolite transporter (DMT)-like permease